ncbi:MAG: dihydrofolate reductase [Candidatus Nomurabacteria bacterium]|jgi:dihydrofolate reductase|nr:dihydrofolate reductase [Candidatus Nomurabacteria bacterium]
MISIVAAIGQDRELGKQGRVIWSFREDLDFYLDRTRGKTLLVGKKTFDGLDLYAKGATVFVLNEEDFDAAAKRKSDWGKSHTFVKTDLNQIINDYKDSPDEIVVIGGAGVFAQTLPYASRLYLDEIQATDPDADAFFPEFNKSGFTHEILEQGTVKEGNHKDLKYEAALYTRK